METDWFENFLPVLIYRLREYSGLLPPLLFKRTRIIIKRGRTIEIEKRITEGPRRMFEK